MSVDITDEGDQQLGGFWQHDPQRHNRCSMSSAMLAGINTPKANMKTLKSRRAMLDTLMRHLDMVRLSAGITAALLIG